MAVGSKSSSEVDAAASPPDAPETTSPSAVAAADPEVDAAASPLDAPETTSPSAVAAADPISWWFEAEGAGETDAKVKVTAEIGTELENWCLPGSGRYLLLGEGVEDGMAKAHALRVYMLQQDETYDKTEDLPTKYSDESHLVYSDHFSVLATQPTFTTTEATEMVAMLDPEVALQTLRAEAVRSLRSTAELTLDSTSTLEPTPEESESASESARKRQVQQDESLAMSISESASESARKRQVQQDESLAMSI